MQHVAVKWITHLSFTAAYKASAATGGSPGLPYQGRSRCPSGSGLNAPKPAVPKPTVMRDLSRGEMLRLSCSGRSSLVESWLGGDLRSRCPPDGRCGACRGMNLSGPTPAPRAHDAPQQGDRR